MKVHQGIETKRSKVTLSCDAAYGLLPHTSRCYAQQHWLLGIYWGVAVLLTFIMTRRVNDEPARSTFMLYRLQNMSHLHS